MTSFHELRHAFKALDLMEQNLKVHVANLAQSYYVKLPKNKHTTGDLWRGLPTFDLLQQASASGLVITPACDLANDKSSTISFVPIIPVSEYLLSVQAYGCVRPVIVELLNNIGCRDHVILFQRSPEPSIGDLQEVEREMEKISHQNPARKRILSGLRVLQHASEETATRLEWLASCVSEKKWRDLLTRIVSNSFADDIHFLPPDEHLPYVSAIKQPSVALFRVPLTLKRSWFDEQMRNQEPQANDPLKTGTLNGPFLTDLLTRFARLYIRLGSPDLAAESVSNLVSRIEGERFL